MKYTNHSGGAIGSDTIWETIGNKYGVKTIAYSFKNHTCLSKNPKILTNEELSEGWVNVIPAAKQLNRYIFKLNPYIKNLLSRNWFQVKNSESIFAIGKIIKNKNNIEIVDGGTGYAVSMSIGNKKPTYVFDQLINKWFEWNYKQNKFTEIDTPILTQHFAGIGTRNINENGKNAIKNILKYTFNNNIYDKLKKKYTDKEISESFIFPSSNNDDNLNKIKEILNKKMT